MMIFRCITPNEYVDCKTILYLLDKYNYEDKKFILRKCLDMIEESSVNKDIKCEILLYKIIIFILVGFIIIWEVSIR